jgi:hypothetical protein
MSKRFIILLVISLFAATINAIPPAFWPPLLPLDSRSFTGDWRFDVSICLAVLWILLFIVGIKVFGKRGLWLLVGMPFAFFWPIFWTLLLLGYINAPI